MNSVWKFKLDFEANPETTPEQVKAWVKELDSAMLRGATATVRQTEDAFALRMRIDANILSIKTAEVA